MSALDRILHIVQTLYTSNDILFGIEEAKVELSDLRARITELEADALARLIEEPTNERIMKDVYEENERLQKAVEEAEKIFDRMHMIDDDMKMWCSDETQIKQWLKEYGGKE